MNCQMKPLASDPARLTGLSEKLIVSHYGNNYGGVVKRLNAARARLRNRPRRERPAMPSRWVPAARSRSY
jgi:hypothetical protein